MVRRTEVQKSWKQYLKKGTTQRNYLLKFMKDLKLPLSKWKVRHDGLGTNLLMCLKYYVAMGERSGYEYMFKEFKRTFKQRLGR